MRKKQKRYRRKKKLHLKTLKFDRHPYIKNHVHVHKIAKTTSPTECYITDRLNAVVEQKECALSVNLLTKLALQYRKKLTRKTRGTT